MTSRPAAAEQPWLSRNLFVLSGVSFFQDAASELLYPVLPIFLTTTLGAPVAVVAIAEGLAEGVASVTRAVSGWLADRRGRKELVGAGYGLAATAKVLIATATVWPVFVAARVLDRVGKGVRGAPRDALIADTVPAAHRGRAFGFHRAADSAGAVVGPLVGLGLYELLDHRVRPLLIVATVPAIVSVALVALVHDVRPQITSASERPEPSGALPSHYWRVVTLIAAFSTVNFTDALLLLRARHLGLGLTGVIAVYALYNLVYAAASYPAGSFSDRVPRRIVYATGLLVFAVAYAGLGVVDTAGPAWGLLALYGCYTALTDGVSKAWIVDLVPAEHRGRAIGIQQGLAGGGAIVAGLWAGLLWHDTGRVPLLVAGAVAAAIAAVLVFAGSALEGAPAVVRGT